MNAHIPADLPRLSTAQLSELALDAAIEVEDVISKRAFRLDHVKKLIQSVISTLDGSSPIRSEGRLDLAYLSIYESAVEAADQMPTKNVADFRKQVYSILDKFIVAERADDNQTLVMLRDFCLAVHEQALAQRVELARSSRRQSSYASRPF